MSRMYGLIYKVASYKEFSKLVFVYTPEGKKTLNARGSQLLTHPYRVLIEYLNLIEFENKKNSLFFVLNKVFLLNDYKDIKKKYQNIQKAALILELIDKTVSLNDDHSLIFQEVVKALQFFQTGYLSFALRLLKFLGYPIEFDINLIKNSQGIGYDLRKIIRREDKEEIFLNLFQTQELIFLYSSYRTKEVKSLSKILSFIDRYYKFYLDIKLQNLY